MEGAVPDARGRLPWLHRFTENIDKLTQARRTRLGNAAWDLSKVEKQKAIHGLSHEILQEAFAVEGRVDPQKVHGYNNWRATFDRLETRNGAGWRRSGLEIDINHGAPKDLVKRMWENTDPTRGPVNLGPTNSQLLNDEIPAFPFAKNRHRKGKGTQPNGVYERTFHDLLEGNAEREIPGFMQPGTTDPRTIREALKSTYEYMQEHYGARDGIDYDSMAKVVDAWLRSKGVP